MSYYKMSGVDEPVRVPIGPDRTQDASLGAVETFWAGFNPEEVARYTVHPSYGGAVTAWRLMLIANGGKPTADDLALIEKLSIPLKTPYVVAGVGVMKTPLEIIQNGMRHMAANPKKSGSFIGKVKNIALNVATGGLYSIGKAAVNIAKGKSVLKEAAGALASQGTGGAILTPVVGTDKSLALQAAIAATALTAGAASPLISKAMAAGAAPLASKALSAVAPIVVGKAVSALLPSSAPSPSGAPISDEGIPPAPYPDGPVAPVQAGLFGNLDPVMIGLLFGVPVVLQLLLRERK